MNTNIKALFQKKYPTCELAKARFYFAPGRVNLIGEHLDYNGGHVMPCALTRGTYLGLAKRTDRQIHLYSDNFKSSGIVAYCLQSSYAPRRNWTDYLLGVLQILQDEGHSLDIGFDLVCYGDIPNGAGLSSSSSLEMAMITALNHSYALALSDNAMVKIAQRVENDFIGVNSGVMDQFVIGQAKANHALLIDTKSLSADHIPIQLANHQLVVVNSNKRRGLADSKYNERYGECQTLLAMLKPTYAIETLCDLPIAKLDCALAGIADPVLQRRLRHVVSEEHRTVQAAKLLQTGNIEAFGQLMNDSHRSLSDDYQVTGPELDYLVAASQAHPAVIGARMTGAGFGGCIVALVRSDDVDAYIQQVGDSYQSAIGYAATFYKVVAGDGARSLNLNGN